MTSVESLTQTLATAFNRQQADVLARVIHDSYSELVKTSDFNELKAIVKDIAESQKQLAAAQVRTEGRLDRLVEAQEGLANAQTRTEVSLKQLARDMGGLARSMAFSLENEAYRALPAFLEANHNIRIDERFVRTQLGGQEVDVFARGTRDGRPVVVVGEAKLQLDERRGNRQEEDAVFAQLAERVEYARAEFPDVDIVPILLTHYARSAFLTRAQEAGVIVVQSFEW